MSRRRTVGRSPFNTHTTTSTNHEKKPYGGGGGGGGSDTVVACVCFSIPMHACTLISGCQTTSGDYSRASAPPCPCPHDRGSRPCTCVQGPKNYLTKNCACGVSTAVRMNTTVSMNCTLESPRTTRRTATAVTPQLSARRDQRLSLHHDGHVRILDEELQQRKLHWLSAMLDQGTCVAQ